MILRQGETGSVSYKNINECHSEKEGILQKKNTILTYVEFIVTSDDASLLP